MDVADPERERDSWRVADEGRGIDLVLEFRNQGKKHKDLVENVKDYAHLGIAEYFSLDCRSKMLRGWWLSSPAARVYTQMMPQGGVFPSQVLELELGVAERRLCFFKNLAQIPTSEELLGRLQRMTDAYQDRLEDAERTRNDAERARNDAERARKEVTDRLVAVRAGMAERLLRRLAERGLSITDAQRAQVMACEDEGRLLDWLDRASSAPTADDVLSS